MTREDEGFLKHSCKNTMIQEVIVVMRKSVSNRGLNVEIMQQFVSHVVIETSA